MTTSTMRMARLPSLRIHVCTISLLAFFIAVVCSRLDGTDWVITAGTKLTISNADADHDGAHNFDGEPKTFADFVRPEYR